jgi:hypothetical protein
VASDFLVISRRFMFGYVYCKNADVFSKPTLHNKKHIASTAEYMVKGKRHGAALDWMY